MTIEACAECGNQYGRLDRHRASTDGDDMSEWMLLCGGPDNCHDRLHQHLSAAWAASHTRRGGVALLGNVVGSAPEPSRRSLSPRRVSSGSSEGRIPTLPDTGVTGKAWRGDA